MRPPERSCTSARKRWAARPLGVSSATTWDPRTVRAGADGALPLAPAQPSAAPASKARRREKAGTRAASVMLAMLRPGDPFDPPMPLLNPKPPLDFALLQQL